MALDSYRAAQKLHGVHPRSCASRAYYAAHAAVTRALLKAKYVPPAPLHSPPHRQIAGLIDSHLLGLGRSTRKELRASMRRLYSARLMADYSEARPIDRSDAMKSVRDAASVLKTLEVAHDGAH